MEKEKQLLILCRQLIEQSLNWGDSSVWGNDDFDQLSEKIFEKTKVQLSVSTLKRLWGRVRYENFPTVATLNALACFAGYEGWRDFRQKNTIPEQVTADIPAPEIANESEITVEENPTGPVKEGKPPFPIAELILFIIFAGCMVFVVSRLYKAIAARDKKQDALHVKFSAVKTSDNLPNSVVFNYDASGYKSDNVFIQQSWDTTRRDRVDGNGKQHTSIYYQPGFFVAKLIINDQIVKQCPIFIKTKGWLGVIEKQPVPIYLSPKEIKGNHYMGVTDSILRQKTGVPVFNDVITKFANVREFKDIDAGNFILETTLRNSSSIEASVCRMAKVVILATGSAIIIPLSDKGCISDLDLLTGDVWISGKNHDMSGFGCDFNQFQTLKCVVEKQTIKIYLNNKLILFTSQTHSLDEIVGIRYEFAGSGEVKAVKLSTPGAGSYSEQF